MRPGPPRAVLGRSEHRVAFTKDWDLQGRGSGFRVDKWHASTFGVEFLDVFVHKSSCGTRLAYKPHFKATSLGVPLHSSSAHHGALHRSWPKGFNFRLAGNSSDQKSYLHARKIFVQRLRKFHCDEEIVRSVESVNAFKSQNCPVLKRPLAGHAARAARSWAVLPSHPLWHRAGIPGLLKVFEGDPLARTLWGLAAQASKNGSPEFPSIAVSWKNEAKHLFLMLRNL